MSVPFSRPGAVDLSSLKSPAPAGGGPAAGDAAAHGAYSVEITSENFQTEMQRSMQVPVVVCF